MCHRPRPHDHLPAGARGRSPRYRVARQTRQSGTRDSNPRHPAWEAGTLPTELVPQTVRGLARGERASRSRKRAGEPIKKTSWRADQQTSWRADQRSRKRTAQASTVIAFAWASSCCTSTALLRARAVSAPKADAAAWPLHVVRCTTWNRLAQTLRVGAIGTMHDRATSSGRAGRSGAPPKTEARDERFL
jgi:hypothetical protein